MGMFDYVRFAMDCPSCGVRMSEFQSKDGECLLGFVDVEQVNKFYGNCDSCGHRVEFSRMPHNGLAPVRTATLKEVLALGFEQID